VSGKGGTCTFGYVASQRLSLQGSALVVCRCVLVWNVDPCTIFSAIVSVYPLPVGLLPPVRIASDGYVLGSGG
jgi:hypothetical protein